MWKMVAERQEWMIGRLRAANMRPTPSRLSVLTYFCDHPEQHLTVKDLTRAFTRHDVDMKLGTLPMCLKDLARNGLLDKQVGQRGEALYSLHLRMQAQCS
ncbi:MAG: transcriptional repressor [Aquabacterium sp.]